MNAIFAWMRRAFNTGALAALGLTAGLPCIVIRKRFTAAEINAGATLVAAPGVEFKLRLADATMISIGGAAAGATTVDINGTRAAGAVKLLAAAIANLTQSALLRAGGTGGTVLADGASFTDLDANTAITVGKTGATLTGSTHVDVIAYYTVVTV